MRHELLTSTEMAEADRHAVALGATISMLMENAGRAVACEAAKMVAPGARIAVLCGPGDNGGDGFVAARRLEECGYKVHVELLCDRDALRGDAAAKFRLWNGATRAAAAGSFFQVELIVDALFGAGLSRPLSDLSSEIIRAANASRRPVLAVDLPSGLDGVTGTAAGAVVQATRTITFFRKKPGHLLLPGRALCGDIVIADIGISETVLELMSIRTHENEPELWLADFPWPKLDGHKYQRGHAVVLSGPAEQTGAARLSARASLRVGAGVVTLVGDRLSTAVNATHMTSVMVRTVSGQGALREFLSDRRRNAVLIGPGASIGVETACEVLVVLQSAASVVLDADALTSFAPADVGAKTERSGFGFLHADRSELCDPETLFKNIAERSAPVVMTPHEGEFKKLFGALHGDKLSRARSAARQSGAIVVLKGADTVIASPDGRAAINANAPPWLATAGSGDVLAGLVTGLLAQRMPAFEAAAAAVWLHGECAKVFGIGLIAEDLPEILPRILAQLHDNRTR